MYQVKGKLQIETSQPRKTKTFTGDTIAGIPLRVDPYFVLRGSYVSMTSPPIVTYLISLYCPNYDRPKTSLKVIGLIKSIAIYVAIKGSVSSLSVLAVAPTGGALNSSFGAAGKSSLL